MALLLAPMGSAPLAQLRPAFQETQVKVRPCLDAPLAPGADGREIVAACAAAEIACERAAVAAAQAASGKGGGGGGVSGNGGNLLVSYGSLPGSVNGGSLPSSPAGGSIGAFYPPTQPPAFAPLTGYSSACSSPGPPPQQPPYGAVPSRMFAQGQYNGSGGNLLMMHQKAQLQSKAAAAFGGGGGGGIGGLRVASASAVAAAGTTASPCPQLLAANLSLGGLSTGGQQAVLRVAGLCATLLPPEGGGAAAVSSSGGGGGDSDSGAGAAASSQPPPDLSRVLEALGLASVFPYLTARLSPGGAAAAAALAAAALAKGGLEATGGSSGGGAAPSSSSSSSSPSKDAATTCSGLASHLAYVSLLNQAVTVGTQLHHDASCQPSHHKYAAHQVALLYQSLNALGGSDRTRPLRRAIESKFDRLKQVTEACARPVLPEDLARWVQRVAWAAREEVRGFPAYAHRRLIGLAGAAKARPTRRGVAAAMAAAARQRQQEQQQQAVMGR